MEKRKEKGNFLYVHKCFMYYGKDFSIYLKELKRKYKTSC